MVWGRHESSDTVDPKHGETDHCYAEASLLEEFVVQDRAPSGHADRGGMTAIPDGLSTVASVP